ncbi:HEAT repeat domain-containing protein [Phenylobacterium sp.]|uniref:HEAT repeat domain-containing protein n=1 Tax=Phenylobacterium sp. TaxID=1871053 RepID=UPI003983A97B
MSLEALWILIAVLVLFAVLLLLGLVVARVVRDRLMARRDRQRAMISKALLATVREDGSGALRRHAGKDLLVAETALNMADLVRGPELERMQAALVSYGLGPSLIRRLTRGRKRQRMVAAEALALVPTAGAVEALNRARGDRSAEVRLSALFSLLDLGEAPTIPEILETVRSGPWSRSLLVTELLRRLGRENQTELAAEIDRDDLPAPVQVMLLEAVGGAGDFEVLPTVAAQADDPDPKVRAAAVRAMGRLAHPVVSQKISRALEDRNSGVRRDAVVAAHRAGLHELAPALGRRLNDRVWGVRQVAAQALADLGEPGQATLREVLAAVDDERRREIELAIQDTPSW